MYYVYCLLDINKNGTFKYGEYEFKFEPFYIGKGSNNRINQHFENSSYKKGKTYKERKIRKLLSEGHKPISVIIESGMTETKSFELEKKLIKIIGRKPIGPLTNGTNGGEGTSGHTNKNKGKKFEEIFGKEEAKKIKKKMSENLKGISLEERFGEKRAIQIKEKIIKNLVNAKGCKRSKKTKEKISKSLIGNNRHLGKKHSKETKKRISKAKKGKISWNAIPIIQMDKEENFVCEWRSAAQAAKILKLSQGNIWSVINGKRKTCGNYKWKLKYKKNEQLDKNS